ncbi:LuxS/MPP-like metallohydrolase [Eremomyces bilateralis CBS 781.70]|uniref:LuxS/MPP-like metallohydrolase n=1 Tax=Eremomyces bilateralis CBS 781.70 TaxID=1392243 RepID=A0A6G1G7G1_9PEZI|nr:LuxS/MPP-like metallohydrolase [Eremomyces bilateralis CBS 781.70]KAF1813871.1 LuxS/MPP-like metallohydrolase [Eremomyces bilateralis CBS 781.70]
MNEPTKTRLVERVAEDIERPELDNRSYRVIKLPNGLEALLIHDPETDKASASLDVNIGSFSDAADMPGLAHAVEHVLFMGTKKYPRENDYHEYLNSNSGSSNAYTASTSTNFFFEVAASSSHADSAPGSASTSQTNLATGGVESPLHGALDRFAQFFIEPLFLEETLDRELRAVDSENKKNLQSDNWRLHQINKSLSNPKHPYNHFSTGNYKTLHDDPIARGVRIRDEFMKFYHTHYSANRMKLALLGLESLDTLEQWVTEMFSAVENKMLPRLRWDISPLTENELCVQVFAKPVFDMRSLELSFPYPDEEHLYESHPSRYLSHLIGHEGPGSILAYLKNKGWASGLGAGMNEICPGSALFNISVSLTEQGLENYQEVILVIFQYISILTETAPQKWVVDELKGIAEVDFRFKQKSRAMKTTSQLSSKMQKPFKPHHILSGSSIIRHFNPEAIQNGLRHLRPDNFRMLLVSQKYPGVWNQKEKWYGTEYTAEKIPLEFLERIHKASKASSCHRAPELHLPMPNEFVPTRLDVEKKEVAEPSKFPSLLRNEENMRLWHKKDDRFWVPKAFFHVLLRTPLAFISARNAVIQQLYIELVRDELVEYVYAAEIAGLDCGEAISTLGVKILVHGYNDKMPVLLEKVLTAMRDLDIRQDRFDILKERLTRGYRNLELQQPYQQIGGLFRSLIVERFWSNDQLLAEMDAVTIDDVRQMHPLLLGQFHTEILAHGNLYKEDALKMASLIETILRPQRLPRSQWPLRRSLVFPPGSNFRHEKTLRDPANVNNCIELHVYAGNQYDRVMRAKVGLFAQIADEPSFDQLRTKEQLGYIVWSTMIAIDGLLGFRVLIQSERSPEYLEKRIEVFLQSLGKRLEEMTDIQFEKHKRAIINRRLERLKNLSSETDRFTTHILSERFDFLEHEIGATYITNLTKSDIIAFYNEYISPASPTRAKLTVHLRAQNISSPADKTTALLALLAQLFQAANVPSDASKLAERFQDIDVASGDHATILGAVRAYLVKDAGMDETAAAGILEQGKDVLGKVLVDVGAAGEKAQAPEADEEALVLANGEPTLIEDIRLFKAGLPMSAAAVPVQDLSFFEELEPKL